MYFDNPLSTKKRLLVSNTCGNCEKALILLKTQISTGEIEVINIDTNGKDVKELAKLFGGVPTLIEEKDGELYELKLF